MAIAQLDSAALAKSGWAADNGDAGRPTGPRAGTTARVSSGDIRPCSGKSGAQMTGRTRPSGPQGKVGEPRYAAL
jgi:hypothetical protein